LSVVFHFFFQAEDGIRDFHVTGVQTCALPISRSRSRRRRAAAARDRAVGNDRVAAWTLLLRQRFTSRRSRAASAFRAFFGIFPDHRIATAPSRPVAYGRVIASRPRRASRSTTLLTVSCAPSTPASFQPLSRATPTSTA